MPSFPVPEALVSDDVVTLRLSAERDIPEVLIAYQDDPQLARALGERRPPSGAALGSRAERASELLATGEALVFSILEAGAEPCRGEVRISDVDWQHGRAQYKIWVAPGFRGRGYATRAGRLAGDWLAERCGLDATCSRTV